LNSMTKLMKMPNKIHNYIGSIAMLDTGNSVKILGGTGRELYVQTLDGSIQRCYHSQLRYIYKA
jgi:hypothetical protein